MKQILIALYIILTSLGLVLLKIGGDSISITFKPIFQMKIDYITIIGIIVYLISFLVWEKLLTIYDVSYIFPLTMSIIQILLLIIDVLIFKVKVNFYGILGSIIIIIGVILLTIGKNNINIK